MRESLTFFRFGCSKHPYCNSASKPVTKQSRGWLDHGVALGRFLGPPCISGAFTVHSLSFFSLGYFAVDVVQASRFFIVTCVHWFILVEPLTYIGLTRPECVVIKVHSVSVKVWDGQQSTVQWKPWSVRPGFWGRQEQQVCRVPTLWIQGAVPGHGGVCRERGKVYSIRESGLINWLTL